MKMNEVNQNEFKHLYLEEEYSTRDLASHYKVGQTTIRRWLKKWEIPVRNYSESRKTNRFLQKLEDNAEKLRFSENKVCLYCGDSFEIKPHQRNRKYCSLNCSYKHKEKKKILVTCTYCKKEYLTEKRNLKFERKFCSSECQGAFKKENFSGEDSPHYHRIKRYCGYCKKEILVPLHRNKYMQVYCGIECMGKDYETRMEKEGNPRWRGGKIFDYGANWNRMRKKRLELDNNSCQLCKKSSEELNKHLHVHHIRPIRLFKIKEEANSLNNLITLCNSCHSFIHSKQNTSKLFLID